ncbi:PAS domain S-box-containing protein [Georgenia satyanarayanai]|uniref:PAS domain S-box-containing protein n=1 Tax=Georgenia satyanarayanai TaxID=860221 RepID=A0A2Y9ARX8_9MICO|nr:SpoIIE family protein phosphatase [Georgenia satyanarayanai]PYF98396.1 PAS domain S-box-containing protein [Georgenia satyanarayanai]SSA45029.1 PAS domain S-box-containing protein [Georgenia satyanarayanai]
MTGPDSGVPAPVDSPTPPEGVIRTHPGRRAEPARELPETFLGRSEHLLEALPDPTYVVDVDLSTRPAGYRVVWVSSSLAQMTGYSVAELRDSAPELVTAHGRVRTALREALAAGLPVSVVRSVPRKDGTSYRATVSFSPLGPGAGGWGRWLVTVRDATEELASAVLAEERAAAEERAQRGLSLVARVSDILADVDSATALVEISALLERRIVPWAAFYADGTQLQKVTDLAGISYHRRDLRRQARVREVPDPVVGLFLDTRMQTVVVDPREPVDEGTLTGELLALVAQDDSAPDDGPLWLLPVLGRKAVLAVLAVRPPDLEADESALPAGELTTVLELVARRVGMAMDNLQLYDREHRLAETLQRAMLPEQSHVEGVDVWSYYAPSSEHAQVGGDWYDVLDMGEGRVGVVVGDVVGHDVEAAAAMGQLRSVVRAYAAEFVEPGKVLGRVDRLVAGMRIARPASFVYATLHPRPGGETWDVAYSRAGHLPIVHVSGGRATQLEGANGPLVGFGGRPRHTGHAVVRPGDVLVFYTDGLVERRDRSMRDGVAALVSAAEHIDAPDAAGIGEELLQQLADAPEDDIAVVVLRVPDPASDPTHTWSGPRERRWQMPMDPKTIARARHAVLRACEAWDIADTAAAELVASELVANAVMHGWGRVDLRLRDTGDGLRIEVEDANPSPPVVREGRVGRVGGFGLHIISRLAEWGWRPTPAGKVVWARVRAKEAWAQRPAEE